MGFLFEPFTANTCSLCGSNESLTGEHKIKASELREIFGREPMAIGSIDSDKSYRFAQGVKSKKFHFSAPVCSTCNNVTTQPSDIEFAAFHQVVKSQLAIELEGREAFNSPRYREGSTAYLNIFRYFAKLLSCHIASVNGPRPIHLSSFALSQHNNNCIFLAIDQDPVVVDQSGGAQDSQYAAHGGLIVPINKRTLLPTKFWSSLTLSNVRYCFWHELNWLQAIALKSFHSEFWSRCEEAFRQATNE